MHHKDVRGLSWRWRIEERGSPAARPLDRVVHQGTHFRLFVRQVVLLGTLRVAVGIGGLQGRRLGRLNLLLLGLGHADHVQAAYDRPARFAGVQVRN